MNIFNRYPFLIAEIGVNFYDIAEKEGISDMDAAKLMIDEAKSNYTIQLSLYQMGIEQLGYEVADRKIIWLKDDGLYEKISVPDVTKDLKAVL